MTCLVPIYIAERTENNFYMGPCVCYQNKIFRKELVLTYIELATSTFKKKERKYMKV